MRMPSHTIEDNIAAERFDGNRYEPRLAMETQDSATTHEQIRAIDGQSSG